MTDANNKLDSKIVQAQNRQSSENNLNGDGQDNGYINAD